MSAEPQGDSLLDNTRTADVASSESDALESEIRRRAYEIFLSRGERAGGDLADWLEAERVVQRGQRETEIS